MFETFQKKYNIYFLFVKPSDIFLLGDYIIPVGFPVWAGDFLFRVAHWDLLGQLALLVIVVY